MDKSNHLSIKVEKRSHLSRIVFGLRLFIYIFIGITVYEFYKEYKENGRISQALIEAYFIVGIIMFGLPLLLGYSYYRFYIIELKQDDNILNVKIMDNDEILDYEVDLHKTRVELSRLPTRQDNYRLDFYEGDKRLFYQVNLFDWDRDKLKEVYERLKGYYVGE